MARVPGKPNGGDHFSESPLPDGQKAWLLQREAESLRSVEPVQRLLFTVEGVAEALTMAPKTVVHEVWVQIGQRVMVDTTPRLVPYIEPVVVRIDSDDENLLEEI